MVNSNEVLLDNKI